MQFIIERRQLLGVCINTAVIGFSLKRHKRFHYALYNLWHHVGFASFAFVSNTL